MVVLLYGNCDDDSDWPGCLVQVQARGIYYAKLSISLTHSTGPFKDYYDRLELVCLLQCAGLVALTRSRPFRFLCQYPLIFAIHILFQVAQWPIETVHNLGSYAHR